MSWGVANPGGTPPLGVNQFLKIVKDSSWNTAFTCKLANPESTPQPASFSGSFSSVQFSSVTQLCPTLCSPTGYSTQCLSVHHQHPEFAQTHVHWVSNAIQPSCPLPSPSPALNLSQHQGLFKWVSSLHQVARVLEFQLQHRSLQWTPRTDFL